LLEPAVTVGRILVVDDEPKIVSFLARALTAKGFQVDGATDAARAIELARSGSYDLVILDLLLGDAHGVSVLEAVRELQPDQRFLVLSALDDVESKVRCLELGASDYMTKPFALAELTARVRARLREPEAPHVQRVLRAGQVRLDLQRREANAGAGPVTLSTREFLLLEYLLGRAGQACTREDLLANVWGYAFDPGTNVVDVYVSRLRAKLGDDAIETVRNVGYCTPA